MSLAETRLPSNLAGEAAGRMWMPFGNPPHPDDALRDTSLDAVLLFPELGEWRAIFDRLAVSGLTRTHIATRARVNGVPLLQELHASGVVSEAALYGALADELGVGFVDRVDPDKLVMRDTDGIALLGRRPGAAPVGLREKAALNVVAATDRLDVPNLKQRLQQALELKQRLKIASPSVLRKALFERARTMLGHRAVNQLWETQPDCSARQVLDTRQAFLCGALTVAMLVAVAAYPTITSFSLHLISLFFFLACVGLRFAAIPAVAASTPFVARPLAAGNMPV
jgi:hypothetical protein